MKFRVEVEIDIPDDQATVDDAQMWMASVLDTAFKKPNPITPEEARKRPFGSAWTPTITMSTSEHPYRPRVAGARKAP